VRDETSGAQDIYKIKFFEKIDLFAYNNIALEVHTEDSLTVEPDTTILTANTLTKPADTKPIAVVQDTTPKKVNKSSGTQPKQVMKLSLLNNTNNIKKEIELSKLRLTKRKTLPTEIIIEIIDTETDEEIVTIFPTNPTGKYQYILPQGTGFEINLEIQDLSSVLKKSTNCYIHTIITFTIFLILF